MKVLFKTTSDSGLVPGGKPSPENILKWLDRHIVDCNNRIETSAMNGASNSRSEGALEAYRSVKQELFGKVYNT